MSSGRRPFAPWPVTYCSRRASRALRERHAEARRRALRGGDAGHDLDWNAGGAAGRDLLAGAAEDHRVAALEPHHPLAGPGERDHQRVDLVLLAGGP